MARRCAKQRTHTITIKWWRREKRFSGAPKHPQQGAPNHISINDVSRMDNAEREWESDNLPNMKSIHVDPKTFVLDIAIAFHWLFIWGLTLAILSLDCGVAACNFEFVERCNEPTRWDFQVVSAHSSSQMMEFTVFSMHWRVKWCNSEKAH